MKRLHNLREQEEDGVGGSGTRGTFVFMSIDLEKRGLKWRPFSLRLQPGHFALPDTETTFDFGRFSEESSFIFSL